VQKFAVGSEKIGRGKGGVKSTEMFSDKAKLISTVIQNT
jgi:hypothetical protein